MISRDKLYIPQTIAELRDMLGMMMIYSPTFEDKSGRFPNRNLDTVFFQLNESLSVLRGKLGGERFAKAREMSDQMRRYFEADPDDKTDDTLRGRALINEMDRLLKQVARRA